MQEATRIFLIRHGETLWNTETRIQGHTDIDLNDRGRWQAARVAAALVGEELQAVYTSDLARARNTAQAIAQACRVPLRTVTALRERAFGDFEGKTFSEIEATWPELAQRWRQRDPDFGPPGGEVLASFYERCVQTLMAVSAFHAGGAIAVVAHGGVLDCLYRAATGQSLQAPRTWEISNAGINRLLRAGSQLSLVGWSDVQHLQGQGALDEPVS